MAKRITHTLSIMEVIRLFATEADGSIMPTPMAEGKP